jgi:ABC-2 type transport system ATP-binding protein
MDSSQNGGISVRGLTKKYHDVTAVDSFDLDVPQGSVHGLLGPDGAGKTSLIRALAGTISFQSGEVRICDMDLRKETEHVRPLIGYMPQRFALYEDLTVDENLEFFADLYGVSRAARLERLPRLVQFTRLLGHNKKLGRQLSGGMKQKLALCTVLVHRPRVLLLDEPSTGVDPVSRREFWDIILELKSEGVTILVSTPYMDEAEKCDMLTMMYKGRRLIRGTPAELRQGFPYKLLTISTPRTVQAFEALQGLPDTMTVVIHGESVHAIVVDVDAAIEPIKARMRSAEVPLLGISPGEPGLEDVFVHELFRAGAGVQQASQGGMVRAHD